MDIACSPEMVALARSITDLPVCVSAVDPALFPAAVKAGADMVEIGNYDGFYAEGRVFSAEEILRLTVETRALVGPKVPLSVTVPHTLPLDQQADAPSLPLPPRIVTLRTNPAGRSSTDARCAQVTLAVELEKAGADIIQTEGGMPMKPSTGGIQGLIEKAAPTLAATAGELPGWAVFPAVVHACYLDLHREVCIVLVCVG